MTTSAQSAVRRAVDLLGGQAAVARRIKRSQQSVFNWIERGCPIKRVLWLERETEKLGTRVDRADMRPDVWGR